MAVAEFPTRLTISKAPQGRGAGEDVRGRAERGSAATAPMRVPVVVADRHVYLTADLIEELFCDNYRLHRQTALSQPTQFLSHELVNLIGPQGRLDKVRVIGPPRAMNQIELSLADARKLGIEAPLRESGSLVDTPGILIEGPRTCARLEGGVIRALRHVHMSREDAAMYGFHDHDHIDVLAQTTRGGSSCAMYSSELHPSIAVNCTWTRKKGPPRGFIPGTTSCWRVRRKDAGRSD